MKAVMHLAERKNWKEAFADYRFKKMEIERLRSKDFMVSDMVTGSHEESPYTAHPIKVKGVDAQQVKANKERVERLEAECADVEAAINLIRSSKLAMVLRLRYQDGMQWNDVGRELDMSGDTARKQAEAYIGSLQ